MVHRPIYIHGWSKVQEQTDGQTKVMCPWTISYIHYHSLCKDVNVTV